VYLPVPSCLIICPPSAETITDVSLIPQIERESLGFVTKGGRWMKAQAE
jgi:hypothetical protein